ncbi:MAG: hypothetical protein WAV46_01025 [Candidatus Moraniibacteriota bacterium]
MKKSTTYSFWFVTILLTAGIFAGWANYFQAGSLMTESPKRVAAAISERTPASGVLKSVPNIKNIQGVAPQSAPNTPVTKPASVRKTKTS